MQRRSLPITRRGLIAAAAGLATPGIARAQDRAVTFFVVNNMFSTPAYVAAENGYWAQRGLDVKLRITSSGREVVQALQAGEAQLGHVALSTTTPAARASGNLIKGVMPYYNAADYIAKAGAIGIIGRRDRGIDPADPKTLYGKSVALLTGSIVEVYAREWVRQTGLDPTRIKFLSVPVENMPVTIAQGLVDAVCPWEPYTSQVVRELGPNAAVLSRGAGGVISAVLGACANEVWITRNYDQLGDFATGLAEAAQFVRRNPKDTAEILTRYLDGLNVADAAEGLSYGNWDPRLSVCTIQGILQTGNAMAASGLIKVARPFVATDLYDPTVLDRVTAASPELFADLPPLPATLAACKGALPA